MTPAAAIAPAPPALRITIRPAVPEDLGYILDSWRLGWRLSDRCRSLKGRDARLVFDDLVLGGVLKEPDTAILIADAISLGGVPFAAHEGYAPICGWLCHTPGAIPTVHWCAVKANVATAGGEWVEMRGRGIATRLLAAAGVRDDLVFTFRPSERTSRSSAKPLNAAARLLAAVQAMGISAVYRDAEVFLGRRRGR